MFNIEIYFNKTEITKIINLLTLFTVDLSRIKKVIVLLRTTYKKYDNIQKLANELDGIFKMQNEKQLKIQTFKQKLEELEKKDHQVDIKNDTDLQLTELEEDIKDLHIVIKYKINCTIEDLNRTRQLIENGQTVFISSIISVIFLLLAKSLGLGYNNKC